MVMIGWPVVVHAIAVASAASFGRLLWSNASLALNFAKVDTHVSIVPVRLHSAIRRWSQHKVIALINKGVSWSDVCYCFIGGMVMKCSTCSTGVCNML